MVQGLSTIIVTNTCLDPARQCGWADTSCASAQLGSHQRWLKHSRKGSGYPSSDWISRDIVMGGRGTCQKVQQFFCWILNSQSLQYSFLLLWSFDNVHSTRCTRVQNLFEFQLRPQFSNCSSRLWGKLLWWLCWIHPITHFKGCAFEVKSGAIPQLAKAYSRSFAVAMTVTLFSCTVVLYLCNSWRIFVSSLQAQAFGAEVTSILSATINSFRSSVSRVFESVGVTMHAWLNQHVRMDTLLKDFGHKTLISGVVQCFLPTCSSSAEKWMQKKLHSTCQKLLNVSGCQETVYAIADILWFDWNENVHCWSWNHCLSLI